MQWDQRPIPLVKNKKIATTTKAIIIFVFGFIYGLLYISQLLSVWEAVVHDVIVAKTSLRNQLAFWQSQQQSRKSFKWHYTQMKRKQVKDCKQKPEYLAWAYPSI